MSDREALKIFSRQTVSQEMISYLVATTNSIIQIKTSKPQYSPLSTSNTLISPVSKKNVALVSFIKNLIKYSNVQTPTLMATLIYLNKLRNLLPANAVGMETTRHRIFLASLILSAKSLNDSSPLNKHWTKYTDGLLTIDEVNMAEKELLNLLNWNVSIKEDELIIALQPFLTSIKQSLAKKMEDECNQKINYYRLSNAYGNRSVNSSRSSSSSSISSYNSSYSLNSSTSTYSLKSSTSSSYNLSNLGEDEKHRKPLSSRSLNILNLPRRQQLQSQNKLEYYNNGSVVNLINSNRITA